DGDAMTPWETPVQVLHLRAAQGSAHEDQVGVVALLRLVQVESFGAEVGAPGRLVCDPGRVQFGTHGLGGPDVTGRGLTVQEIGPPHHQDPYVTILMPSRSHASTPVRPVTVVG